MPLSQKQQLRQQLLESMIILPQLQHLQIASKEQALIALGDFQAAVDVRQYWGRQSTCQYKLIRDMTRQQNNV